MKMDKRIPQWNNAVILEKKADGTLIVYSRSSGRLFQVRGIAAQACEALDGSTDIGSILSGLMEDVDPSHQKRLSGDLMEFLEDLESRSLITFSSS